jgi:hypothetical protein
MPFHASIIPLDQRFANSSSQRARQTAYAGQVAAALIEKEQRDRGSRS